MKTLVREKYKQGRLFPVLSQVPLYWSEVPRAKFIKQGAAQQISFTAKLTVSDQTAQWFFKEVSEIRSDEHVSCISSVD